MELIDLYVQYLQSMAKHSFMASWNYCQFKRARTNIKAGELLLVNDFAQNYLSLLQNKLQSMHWEHKQVTLHPTVAYYTYPNEHCASTVTHELVYISEDLKHDTYVMCATREDDVSPRWWYASGDVNNNSINSAHRHQLKGMMGLWRRYSLGRTQCTPGPFSECNGASVHDMGTHGQVITTQLVKFEGSRLSQCRCASTSIYACTCTFLPNGGWTRNPPKMWHQAFL